MTAYWSSLWQEPRDFPLVVICLRIMAALRLITLWMIYGSTLMAAWGVIPGAMRVPLTSSTWLEFLLPLGSSLFILAPVFKRLLGRWFLPLALLLALLDFSFSPYIGDFRFSLLLIPVFLAAWAYSLPGGIGAGLLAIVGPWLRATFLPHIVSQLDPPVTAIFPIFTLGMQMIVFILLPSIVVYLVYQSYQQQISLNIARRRVTDYVDTLATLRDSRQQMAKAAQIFEDLDRSLSTLVGQVESLQKREVGENQGTVGLPAAANPELERVASASNQALQDTRRAARELSLTRLQTAGLVTTLNEAVRSFRQRTSIDAAFQVTGTEQLLPDRLNQILLDLVEEALRNIEKHANARAAAVQLLFETEMLEVHIQDDGSGFTQANVPTAAETGLQKIQDSLLPYEGELTIESSPGQGTDLLVRIPLPGPS
ncbi:MAG: hypothetical protein HY326_11155 [Chloroflexi bacterium]|nr:hypothetical protein [Chloroflexota bacterium]